MLRPRIRRLFRLAVRRRALLHEELDEEIRFHLEARAEQLVRRGMNRDAARAEALRRFGSPDDARRLHHSAERREDRMQWRERLDGLTRDLRYALRALRRQPGYVAGVVVTLALGIGANTTMFGIVDRLLLRPPAYLADPAGAGRLYLFRTWEGQEGAQRNIQYRRYLDLRERTHSFAQMVAFWDHETVVGTGQESREERVSFAGADLWRMFSARPALGRFYTAREDELPAGTPVAVLGWGYWQSRYGGARDVLGKSLRIGRTDYTIIGVAPEGFTGVSPQTVVAFVPISAGASDAFGDREYRGHHWYDAYTLTWTEVVARRKPGVTPQAADADLTAAFRWSLERGRAQGGDGNVPFDKLKPHGALASIIEERGPEPGAPARVATWLAGVALLVLLMACANVANLMLARTAQRRREIAVRVALGVSRARLLGQQLGESLLLALLAGAAGLLAAMWGGGVLRRVLLPDIDWSGQRVDVRMVLFTVAIALMAGLLAAIAPAVHARRGAVTDALKAGGREGGLHRSRLRMALLVVQASVSVVLLVGAGLFVRSLHNVRALDLGFEPERVLVAELRMRGVKLDSAARAALKARVLERVTTLPGVEAASYSVSVPFYSTWDQGITVPGRDSSELRGNWQMNAVTPDYFRTMGNTLVRGRGITDGDVAGHEPVVVISQAAARAIWPHEDPLGKCVQITDDPTRCNIVVGVVSDIRMGFGEPPARYLYFSIAQRTIGEEELLLRTRGDAARAVEGVRREIQALLPGDAFAQVQPLASIVAPNLRSWQLGATMFTLFGLLALVVSAVGLYSVVSYGVTQRAHEMGVRIALGARTNDLVRLVVVEGLRTTVIGVVLGVAAALVAGRWVAPLLYEVSPRDLSTFTTVLLVLIAIAVTASLAPALRAARVDPNVALRSD